MSSTTGADAPCRRLRTFWRWKKPAGRALAAPRCCPTGRHLRPAAVPDLAARAMPRSRCCGQRQRRFGAGADLLRNDRLYLENRVRRRIQQVFAGRAVDRQDDRRTLRRIRASWRSIPAPRKQASWTSSGPAGDRWSICWWISARKIARLPNRSRRQLGFQRLRGLA